MEPNSNNSDYNAYNTRKLTTSIRMPNSKQIYQ